MFLAILNSVGLVDSKFESILVSIKSITISARSVSLKCVNEIEEI